MNPATDFLYASPSFWGGAAQIIDFGDTLTVYNRSASPNEADARALWSDWMLVGMDIRAAIESQLEMTNKSDRARLG